MAHGRNIFIVIKKCYAKKRKKYVHRMYKEVKKKEGCKRVGVLGGRKQIMVQLKVHTDIVFKKLPQSP